VTEIDGDKGEGDDNADKSEGENVTTLCPVTPALAASGGNETGLSWSLLAILAVPPA
jgi:hypothetical protein